MELSHLANCSLLLLSHSDHTSAKESRADHELVKPTYHIRQSTSKRILIVELK